MDRMCLYVLLLAVAASSTHAKLVLTPFGYYEEECVHGVPHDTHVHNVNSSHLMFAFPDGTSSVFNRCKMQPAWAARRTAHADALNDFPGDGWQVYVHQKVGTSKQKVTGLLGSWNVPPNPAEQAQTLFTFTGLQNIDWVPPNPDPVQAFDIIQPVLQFGVSSAGGGGYWTMASWYVTLTSDVVFSPLVKVKAGDVIFGNMTKVGKDSWFINSVDVNATLNSTLNIHRSILGTQPWTYVTLEVYDVDTCAQYPPTGSTCKYTDLKLLVDGKPMTPKWSVGKAGQTPPICDASIDIDSPNEVTIKW